MLKRFYKKYYQPNRAAVVVVGDVDKYEVFRMIRNYYGDIVPSELKTDSIEPEPEQLTPRRSTLKLNTQVEKLVVSYPSPANTHIDAAVFDMIEALMSHGKASRLNRALVDTGIASSASCDSNSHIDPALFSCWVSMQDGKPAALAEKVITDELKRLETHPITHEELDRARSLINFHIYQSLGENQSRAHWLGAMETQFGRFEIGLQLLERTLRVSPQDIKRVARQYFRPERKNVVVGVPK